jgi:hypothetical protein
VSAEHSPEEDLAKAVERLMSSAAGEPVKAAPPPADNGKIDSLDAELAGLADDLIAGEFKDEDAVLAEPGSEAPAPEAAAPLNVTEATPTESIGRAAPPPPPPSPAAPIDEPAETAPSLLAEPEPKLPLLLRLLDALSSPVRGRSQHTRDMVGWIALVTAFNAVCLWGYLGFLRPAQGVARPAPPPAAEPAPAKPSEPESGHGGSKSASPSKKTAASRAPKKPGAKREASAEHH